MRASGEPWVVSEDNGLWLVSGGGAVWAMEVGRLGMTTSGGMASKLQHAESPHGILSSWTLWHTTGFAGSI